MPPAAEGNPDGLCIRWRARWVSPVGRRLRAVAYWGALAALVAVAVRRYVPDYRLPDLGPAPVVSYRTLDGGEAGPQRYRGRVVVLNVWATWCPPCVVETPGFVRLAGAFAENVQFLGVAQDTDTAAVRAFVRRHRVPYPMLVGAPVGGAAGPADLLPTTLVIDRRGRVRLRHEGLLLAPALRPILRTLVAE